MCFSLQVIARSVPFTQSQHPSSGEPEEHNEDQKRAGRILVH